MIVDIGVIPAAVVSAERAQLKSSVRKDFGTGLLFLICGLGMLITSVLDLVKADVTFWTFPFILVGIILVSIGLYGLLGALPISRRNLEAHRQRFGDDVLF
jgi:hypothetical protein